MCRLEVKQLKLRSRSESESEQGAVLHFVKDGWHILDPKPGELPMVRVKAAERRLEVRTPQRCKVVR